MSERTHITADMLRAGISELLLACTPFARLYGRKERTPAQQHLFSAIDHNKALLSGPIDHAAVPTDPDKFIQAYLAAGGSWRELVAAISRNATNATCQRHQRQKEIQNEQTQSQ